MQFRETDFKKAVTFSYDDGTTQDIRLVELLNQYGLKCTFNLNSQLMGKRGVLLRNGMQIAHYKLAARDVQEIYKGHEIAAHTLTHPNLTKLEEDEIIRQVEQDRLNLSELAGYEVVGMAYPCCAPNSRVVDIVKNRTGVQYSRSVEPTDSFDRQENLHRFRPNVYHIMEYDRLMDLGRKFVELQPAQQQIFYIWGHSFELDYSSDAWMKLEEFFRLIANRDDVFYGTNQEVLL